VPHTSRAPGCGSGLVERTRGAHESCSAAAGNLVAPGVAAHGHQAQRPAPSAASALLEGKQKLGDGDERFTCVFPVVRKEYSYSMSSLRITSGAGRHALVAGDQWASATSSEPSKCVSNRRQTGFRQKHGL